MIVDEYVTEAGVRVTFHDDAYAGASEAEISRRAEQIRQTAWWCAIRAAERAARTKGKS